ncbi:MAG: hypothetical protein WAN50_03610 [Minisyncoccia bacterium]
MDEINKGGRPLSDRINPDEVRKMASIGCTYEEIAQKFKVSRGTIENSYAIEYEAGRVALKQELREAQIRCGKENKGNSGMLIWLGKIYLNQRESTQEERVSELDMIIKHLDLRAECLNLAKNSSSVTEKPQQD